jgi:signal transduction histidine kinase
LVAAVSDYKRAIGTNAETFERAESQSRLSMPPLVRAWLLLKITIDQIRMDWWGPANKQSTVRAMMQAANAGASLCVLPELAVTGLHSQNQAQPKARRRLTQRLRIGARILRLILVLSWAALPAQAADDEARVLILNGSDPYLPAYLVIDSAMRSALAMETAKRVVLFSETLDAQRFPVKGLESEYVALFAKKYSKLRIDVVVTVQLPALEFFNRHGQQLWPGARLVHQGSPGGTALPVNATAVIPPPGVNETIDLAWRMQPDAQRVVVITGVSDLDRRFEQLARKALSTRTEPAPVEFLTGLPLPELVRQVAATPADSIIIYLTQFRDREGRPYTPRDVLHAVSQVSPAPVYGNAETFVGFGAAATSGESLAGRGRLVGEQVRAALAGGPPDPDRLLLLAPTSCVADARALERWSLDRRRLPSECEVRFADTSFWRDHFWESLAAVAVIAGQATLITSLLVQRRRRRLAEEESQARLAAMAHMNRSVAMGGLAASIAHELNQPLGAIYNNAGAAQILIKAASPDMKEVAEILNDIKLDDKRASDVLERIRNMLRKTAAKVEEVDLNEAIGETMKLLAATASAQGVSLNAEFEPGLPKVSADRVQVQQVILNLALNALEAMHDHRAEKREVVIRSRQINDEQAEVSVTDSGSGIDAAMLPRIFDAFVTSKPGGMGLGLSISRTIVEALGGRLSAANLQEGGASFRFTLPLVQAHRA